MACAVQATATCSKGTKFARTPDYTSPMDHGTTYSETQLVVPNVVPKCRHGLQGCMPKHRKKQGKK